MFLGNPGDVFRAAGISWRVGNPGTGKVQPPAVVKHNNSLISLVVKELPIPEPRNLGGRNPRSRAKECNGLVHNNFRLRDHVWRLYWRGH